MRIEYKGFVIEVNTFTGKCTAVIGGMPVSASNLKAIQKRIDLSTRV